MRQMCAVIAVMILSFLMLSGCGEETPDRDDIPLLKKSLFSLQEAVKSRNRAAIDSLLSVSILSYEQSSDSLLSFVYGPDRSFVFIQLALGEIVYNKDKARIDCFVVDTSGRKNRPLVLTLINEHDRWLLKRFEAGKTTVDSL
ncbi:MAG: hypothetical protein U9R56_05050 [candidate division Zixibacteria bacterium]|nr:hypothetical protein [candidate division Zixibacteria bacterium]